LFVVILRKGRCRVIVIQESKSEDTKDISNIYLEAFPSATRSLLGLKTSEEYFKRVLQHNSYSLITASLNNEILGFVVFIDNLFETVGRRWILKHWSELVMFVLKHPIYVLDRLIYRIRALILQKISFSRPSVVSDLKGGSCIDVIAVKKSARGLGVGTSLIMHCIHIAKEKKIDFVNLAVEEENSEAIRLYESIGFKQISYDKNDKMHILSFSC